MSASYAAAVEALVDARNGVGLSQRELADRLGKSRSFVSKIESRERRIDIIEFIALAKALGMQPAALLERVMAMLPESLDF